MASCKHGPNGWRCGMVAFACLLSTLLRGADLVETQKAFLAGDYEKAAKWASQGTESNSGEEEWPLLAGRSLMTLGRYTNAADVLKAALEQFPFSLRLRLLARDAALYNGNPARADELVDEVGQLVNRRPWAYRDSANLIALGKAALLLGTDPKKVLEGTFDRARKANPDDREAALASAELALDKNDPALASRILTEALKRFPEDADCLYAQARAYSSGDRKAMLSALAKALAANEHHVPSYLLLAEHLIDAEEYEEADSKLGAALEVNPHHPEAWALRAVLAHLKNERAQEEQMRKKALQFYARNPLVDHLIGRKLSQKYRFAEGAEYQQRALSFATNYIPAKSQLAQDFLRLGREEEGWALVEEVYQLDGYDVVAFNLANLKDSLGSFITLTNEHFIVRMGKQEAPIYGDRVMELLSRAHTNLCQKYGVQLEGPTSVEVFPDQKDFAVRTFGMPGGAGYLGVCFGRLITANSPATQSGKAASWESVLWHEFCHVVTLQMTRNKMPRWLSEGISVYEELQANPSWGQGLTPRYREMILGDDLRKISDLSGAFLAPPSSEHLMFAYYQSYLVVRFVVEKHGLESLRKILRDLRVGVAINDALARNTAALDVLETEFAAFARGLASELAPRLEWDKPEAGALFSRDGKPTEWLQNHPKNYYVLLETARQKVRARNWAEAKAPLQTLVENYPRQTGSGSPYELLAQAHHALKEWEEEKRILDRWASIDSNAPEAYSRLMELGAKAGDWQAVAENVDRYLAVNPLSHTPYAYWGKAAEATGHQTDAVKAYSILLRLDPPDPAGAHFRLAKLLQKTDAVAARRHLLQSLEDSPRFRDAHSLLLELRSGQ
ncbi:MAG: tetratricopeptide repeat protein [Verrucomicrobia bacterium]|nr:tetratricopeptide repeat protein [Verrucomicrobiota bacterium]